MNHIKYLIATVVLAVIFMYEDSVREVEEGF
jgi:hypothetical protein